MDSAAVFNLSCCGRGDDRAGGHHATWPSPEHARNWTVSDTIRPILPDLIGYTSLYAVISKREKAQNRLLSTFVQHLKATHTPVDSRQFRIGTSI
jgi:hypothetical protein